MAQDRDYQRSKVYKAERIFINDATHLNVDMDWVESFGREITASPYWSKMGGWKRIKLRDGRGARRAFYHPRDRSITLPLWARTKEVMIHEYAHALTHRVQGEYSGHGTYFCGHYLQLVDCLLGPEQSFALMASFDAHGVRYKLL